MRKLVVVISVVSFLFLTTMGAFADEFIVGVVVECSPDRELIQLEDKIYKTSKVFSDDGVHPLKYVLPTSINEGSVVQIFPSEKTTDFWLTEKTIILTGVKKREMMNKFFTPYDPRAKRVLDMEDD